MWETIRSVMALVGDVTPAGTVTDVFLDGELHLVILTIDNSETYTRDFDALMDVCR